MVVTRGDILAELIIKYGLGEVIVEEDHEALADKIVQVLNNQNYIQNFEKVKANYYWSEVTQDLTNYCNNPIMAVDKGYLSKYKRSQSPNKALIYLNKGISLLFEGDFKTLFLKIRQKILKRY
ncbi:hypothetical protein D3C76_1318270 [compost metagenome]